MAPEIRCIDCSKILHGLRCVGVVGVESLAAATGVGSSEVKGCLKQLAGEGLTSLAPGPFGGWSVTDAGRPVDDEWLAGELDLLGAREHVRGCYHRFLNLNPKLLQVCSDWQIRMIGSSPILNDHTDAAYDAKVMNRLIGIDDSAQKLCGDLAEELQRFAVYRTRFRSALEQALAGDHAYVADNLGSYHTIWFHLHEDLLTTLGISREEERRRSGGEN